LESTDLNKSFETTDTGLDLSVIFLISSWLYEESASKRAHFWVEKYHPSNSVVARRHLVTPHSMRTEKGQDNLVSS
jgi:hypothetical protein